MTARISTTWAAVNLLELIYVAAVRQVRSAHGNAFISLIVNVFQSALFVLAFYAMFAFFSPTGQPTAPIRGDFLIYVMTGVFMYMVHIKTSGAVLSSEGPTSPMMQHAPMNTFVAIFSSALGALYIQTLTMVIMLGIYYLAFEQFEIYDVAGCLGMFMLSWLSGVGVGMVFLAAKPWAPSFVGIVSSVYQRINMFASGKMFVANTLPTTMLAMFSWNPLFHVIDQTRGYAFVNYSPAHSNWIYPLALSFALIMGGLIAESYTRKHASASWSARG